MDQYQTIVVPTFGEFKDRGSKFLAYAYPIQSEEEGLNYLKNLKKEHFKAVHYCYAYRMGLDKNNFRANDDGEPSGTAGKPILGQIDSFELTNIIVIVVRYFGGTKLGTSGLIQAYKSSTSEALKQAEITTKYLYDTFRITFDYAVMGDVMNALKKVELEIITQNFEESPYLQVIIRRSLVAEKLLQLKALIAKVSLEEAALIQTLPQVKITCLSEV
ncbi:MAG: YigZ family protein [Saprospiraceae bacterium]|nr:YigZ family protein [Saprospiraceae bacterium]